MTIFVRVDASTAIGTGHVMRCVALATELRRASQRVEFICRETEGTLRTLIERYGFRVHRLQPAGDTGGASLDLSRGPAHAGARRLDAEATAAILRSADERPTWLIVDHYALDAEWQLQQRRHVDRILIVDDLADRPHDCDVLLDQNYPLAGDSYESLVPETCLVVVGPRYALLRDEFKTARANLRPRVGEVRRVLISFGGVDGPNETAKAMRALACPGLDDLGADVVVGVTNPHLEELAARAAASARVDLHVQAGNMAELTARADLAIGAGGSSVWERCCLGLPSVLIAAVDHQVPFARTLAQDGYALYLGEGADVDHRDIAAAVTALRGDPTALAALSRHGLDLVDGRGCERMVELMLGSTRVGAAR